MAVVGSLACCNAYDRTQYSALLDASTDATDIAPNDLGTPVDAVDDNATPDAIERDASDVVCTRSPTLASCDRVGAMPATPVIDGIPECSVTLQPFEGAFGGGSTPPSDFRAEYAVAWRPDGFYAVFVIHRTALYPPFPADDSYCGDTVELFLDSDGVFPSAPLYDDPGARQIFLRAPNSASERVNQIDVWVNRAHVASIASPHFLSVATSDGYVAELFVQASDLGLAAWPLDAGRVIGFDLAIDLGKPAGTGSGCLRYAGQYVYHRRQGVDASCVHPSCDVRAFCSPTLAP